MVTGYDQWLVHATVLVTVLVVVTSLLSVQLLYLFIFLQYLHHFNIWQKVYTYVPFDIPCSVSATSQPVLSLKTVNI